MSLKKFIFNYFPIKLFSIKISKNSEKTINKIITLNLMKSKYNSKMKEKINIEYEEEKQKNIPNNNEKINNKKIKLDSIYDSKMSLAETLLRDKSKIN